MAAPLSGGIFGPGTGQQSGGLSGGIFGTPAPAAAPPRPVVAAPAPAHHGGGGFLGAIERIPGDFVSHAVPDIESGIIGTGRLLYRAVVPGVHPSWGQLAHEWTHPSEWLSGKSIAADPFSSQALGLGKGIVATAEHPARDPFATAMLLLPFVKGGVNFGAATRAGLKGETAAMAAAKAPGVITARAAEGGAPVTVRVLPRGDAYKAGRMKAVDAVLKAVVPPTKPFVGEYARAARSVERAAKVPMLRALADPRFATYQKALGKLDEVDRVALGTLARVPLPKDLEAWKGVLRGQDMEAATRLVDVLSDPKMLERYTEFQRFPKIVRAHEAAQALVGATEEIGLRTGALKPDTIATAPYIGTRVARGAQYVEPTPARLGVPNAAHRVATQRVARLEKLHAKAILTARRNAAAAILGLKGRLTVKQKDAALAVIEGREPSVPGLIGNKIVTAEEGKPRVTTTTTTAPRTPEEAQARLDALEAQHNAQLDAMAEAQLGKITPQMEAGRTKQNKTTQQAQQGITSIGRREALDRAKMEKQAELVKRLEASADPKDKAKLPAARAKLAKMQADHDALYRGRNLKSKHPVGLHSRRKILPSVREERRADQQQMIDDLLAADPSVVERVPQVAAIAARLAEMEQLRQSLGAHTTPEWAREGEQITPAFGTKTTTQTVTRPGAPGVGRLLTPRGGVRAEALGYALSNARDELAQLEAARVRKMRETGLVGGGTPEEIAAEIRATHHPVAPGEKLYHGTSHTFAEHDLANARGEALYGPGVYLTNDRAVASGYAGLGGPQIHEDYPTVAEAEARLAQVKGFGERVNMVPHTEKGVTSWRVIIDQSAPQVRMLRANLSKPFDVREPVSLEEARRIVGDAKDSTGYPVRNYFQPHDKLTGEDVYRVMDKSIGKPAANARLLAAGYDAIKHEGGVISGGAKHEVTVVLDPRKLKPFFAEKQAVTNRPQPLKLPDRPLSEEQISAGSGTGSGLTVPRSPIQQSHGTLTRTGLIDLVHDRLTPHYLANARFEAKLVKHAAARDAAAPVEKGAGRPPGTVWLRTTRGEKIPYLEDVKAEHLAELDRIFPREGEHPFTLTDAEAHANPELVDTDAAGNRLVVSEQFAQGLEHAYRAENTALHRFVSRPLDVWRALVLNLRVPWLLNNIVGNNLLYALKFAGYGGLRAYLNMILDMHGPRALRLLLNDRSTRLTLSREDIDSLVPAQARGTFIGTQLPTGEVARTRVGRKAVKAARFLNAGLAPLDRRTEAFLRRGGVNAVLRESPEAKAIYDRMDPQTASWRDAMMQAAKGGPTDSVAGYRDLEARVTAAEARVNREYGPPPASLGTPTPANWRNWSRRRGYTKAEIDEFARFLAMNKRLKITEPDGVPGVDAPYGMTDEGLREAIANSGTGNPQLLQHVDREVNDALGDYLSLGPIERGALRRAVPFYGWYREITRIAAHTILDRPLRAAILVQLGQMEAERQQDERGLFPTFLQGSLALGPGPAGTENILALRSANPLSTTVDLGRAASFFANPGNRANAEALLGIANPFAQSGGASLFGSARGDSTVQNQAYQGGAADWLSKNLGFPGQVLGSVFGGLPQAQVLWPPPPSRLYPTRTREDIFLRLLGDIRRSPSLQQAHYYASQGR